MDTRSVIRSRRQSPRLTAQLHDGKATQQSTTRRRNSDTNMLAAKPATPKSQSLRVATIKRAERTKSSNMVPITGTPKPNGTAKDHTNTKLNANIRQHHRRDKPAAKWVKTEHGAIRLVDDTTQRVSRDTTSPAEESQDTEASQILENRHRSTRLDSSTPGVEDQKMSATDARRKGTRPFTLGMEDEDAMRSIKESPAAHNRSPAATELQHFPHHTPSTETWGLNLTDRDELPTPDSLSFANHPAEDASFAETTSPIPELLADIARIIETSSPTAPPMSEDNDQYTNGFTTTYRVSTVPMSAASAQAREVFPVVNMPIEIGDEFGHNSFAQSTATRPLLLGARSSKIVSSKKHPEIVDNITSQTAASSAPKTRHLQSGSPRGVKRRADEMSYEEKVDSQHPQLVAPHNSSRAAGVPESIGLIETARSRDNCQIEDGGPDGTSSQTDIYTEETGFSIDRGTSGLDHSASPLRSRQVTQAREYMETTKSEVKRHLGQLHEILKCGDCGKVPETVLVCAKCLESQYCGKYCQIWNWPIHRRVCKSSKEADPDEVKRMEEYLENMWTNALRMLEKNVVDSADGAENNMKEQANLQSNIDSNFMIHDTDEESVEQEIVLPSDGGSETVTAEEAGDAGQNRRGMSGGRMDELDDELQSQENQGEEIFVFKAPPPSPKSMFQSRATALRLAQAAEASAKPFKWFST